MMSDLFTTMRLHAEPRDAAMMQAYMKDQFPFLGIKTDKRRALSKPYLKALKQKPIDWAFVARCYEQPEREFQYIACDYLIAMKKQTVRADLWRLEELICTKSWWDTVDALDEVVGDIHLREDIRAQLLLWSEANSIWLRRVAINHQLRYKDKTDQALLKEILCRNLGSQEFFINKAIGWALREYAKTDPQWVRKFAAEHALSALSRREALKHL